MGRFAYIMPPCSSDTGHPNGKFIGYKQRDGANPDYPYLTRTRDENATCNVTWGRGGAAGVSGREYWQDNSTDPVTGKISVLPPRSLVRYFRPMSMSHAPCPISRATCHVSKCHVSRVGHPHELAVPSCLRNTGTSDLLQAI